MILVNHSLPLLCQTTTLSSAFILFPEWNTSQSGTLHTLPPYSNINLIPIATRYLININQSVRNFLSLSCLLWFTPYTQGMKRKNKTNNSRGKKNKNKKQQQTGIEQYPQIPQAASSPCHHPLLTAPGVWRTRVVSYTIYTDNNGEKNNDKNDDKNNHKKMLLEMILPHLQWRERVELSFRLNSNEMSEFAYCPTPTNPMLLTVHYSNHQNPSHQSTV